jgi:hypothetical protein
MAEFTGFVGGTYQSRSPNVDAQVSINLYPEIAQASSKSGIVLYGTPGMVEFASLGTSPLRALWAGEERLFAVAGSKFYEVFSDGSSNLRGDVGNDPQNSPAQIFPEGTGDAVLVISAGKAYLDNGVSISVAQWTTGGDVEALTGAFLDGYGIVHKAFDKRFYMSNLNRFDLWDPADVQTQEAYPDNIYAILADHRELWVFGDQTIEVYRNEGDVNLIFRTDPSAFIDIGLVATWSATKIPGMGPAWLGGDDRGRVVAYRVSGFSPVRVSNHAVEQAWHAYSTVSDAISWAEVWHGHTLWVITFPTANATWVYDFSTELWHQRAYGAALDRHRGRCHAYTFGKHFLGDHTTGQIFQLDPTIYTDDGTAITRRRAAPHISQEEKRGFFHRFELDLETGQVQDPSFTLDWSNDGGHTWSAGRTITAGALSNYTARAKWWRLGSARDRVFRVTSTAPIRHAWINAYLGVNGGAH